ncbi:hypothetical protein SAMN04488243_1404 [Thermus arciformis]|uniref:Uncharacterized protein n=1 Tax=Thermus arciformis TaxID=482827 RepID=A0A1G7K2Q1_9DEIN|nr:hypothetical protein [Thermus arciformis]SDF31059.1 hypothetical protein SAMN04488243_1404 [Thermus arciformis]
MSARGSYRKPVSAPPSPKDLEALAQELSGLLRQAADPYELAAHLEVLGFNRYRVQKAFGLPDTFALAKALFALGSRDLEPKAKAPRVEGNLSWRHLALALTLGGTLLVFLPLGQVGWLPALFLLSWSQLAARLAQRAAVRLEGLEAQGPLTLAVWLGALGLTLLAPLDRAAWASWNVGLAWIGVGILSLRGERVQALGQSALFAAFATAAWALSLPWLLPGPVFLLYLLGRARLPGRRAWALLGETLAEEWAYPLYGLGQGLLLLQLVRLSGEGALVGLVLYLLGTLLVELRLAHFVRHLGRALWREKDPMALLLAVQKSFWEYFLTASLPTLLLLLAWPWAQGYGPALLGFGLLGLVSAMGLGLNALAEARASALGLLLAALLLHLSGNPLVLGAVGLGLALVLLEHLRHPERYGIYLL